MENKKSEEQVLGKREEALIEKTKKLSIKEGCAYGVMDGFGLRYLTPYALAIGATNTQIGVLSSVPGLLGNLSQLFTFKAMKKWSRKKIIFQGVLFQAIMWLFLIFSGIPFFVFGNHSSLSPNLLIIMYTLLVLFGAFTGPVWTSLMRDIVHKDRGSYFGYRSRATGFVALICMLIAGFVLDYFKQTHLYLGFIILFTIAFFGRLVSAHLFRKHYAPKFKADEKKYFNIFDFIKQMRHNNFGRFVIYYSLFSFACAIAAPFFAVYILKNIGFSYTWYMTILIVNSLASILFMPLWGKFTDKYGALKVIKYTGFLIPILPLLFFFTLFLNLDTTILIFLIITEIFSGLVWAGYNLSAGNFIYDAVSKERLALCSSYFNVLASLGSLIGALLGGYLSNHLFFLGLSPFLWLFLISAILRLSIHWIFSKRLHEVRVVKRFNWRHQMIKDGKRIEKETKHFTKGFFILIYSAIKQLFMSLAFTRLLETFNSENQHQSTTNPRSTYN